MKLKVIEQYKGLRKEAYILFIGTIATHLGGMIWPMLTMILNQKLGLDAATISYYVMIVGFLSIPVQAFGGRLADRCNKKMVIVYADLCSIVLFFICGYIPLSLKSMILYTLASFMQMIEYPSYQALVADITPAKDRTRAYSLMYFGLNLGMMMAPILGGILFKDYLWLAFYINGLAVLVSTVLIYFFVKDISIADEEEIALEEEIYEDITLMEFLKKSPVLILYLFTFAISSCVYNQYEFLLPLDLGRVFKEEGAILYGSLSSLNCILVVLLTASITEHFGKVKDVLKMASGQLLILFGYIVFYLFLDVRWIGYLAMSLFTIGEIFCVLSNGPYLTNRVPVSCRGRVFGISNVTSSIMFSLMSLFIGKTYDAFGSQGAWILLFVVAAIAFVLNVILAYLDPKAYPELEENKK